MPPYLLSPHVYACLSGAQVVLLDLKADRYYALESAHSAALAPLVRGWPTAPAGNAVGGEHIAYELLSRSLLTQNESIGRYATPIVIDTAVRELPLTAGVPSFKPQHVCAAVMAVMRAAILVHCTSLVRIVRRVLRQRSLITGGSSAGSVEVHELIAVFEYLRPFLFSAREACLLECFALIEFLSMHGIFPTWVFGVRTKPFAAHCWLQHDGIVLTDSVGRTCSFTPIMAV